MDNPVLLTADATDSVFNPVALASVLVGRGLPRLRAYGSVCNRGAGRTDRERLRVGGYTGNQVRVTVRRSSRGFRAAVPRV